MNEGFMTFNVAANNQQDAAVMLKAWMENVQIELSTAFPEVQQPAINSLPGGLNVMQLMFLEDLIRAIDPLSENISAKVKELTDLDMTAENFKLIVPILEAIKDNPGATPKTKGSKK